MDELVQVLVPTQHVTKVYGFIAGLEKQEGQGPQESKDAKGKKPEWLDDKFVKRAWDESPPAIRTILKYLGGRADEWVPIADLAKQLGKDADSNTVAGTLGAFTRRCKNRYGHNTWPFEVRSNQLAGGGRGAEYMMPSNYAAKYEAF